MKLTSEQFNKLATKKELKNLVTKNELKKELKNLVTKNELKKELKNLATKNDLKELRQESKSDLKELRQESKSDLQELRQEMNNKFDVAFDMFASKEEAKDAKNEILTAIDGITKQYQEFDVGFAMNQGAHDRFEEKLLKHEKKLELLKKN